jgi:hypothetical protein
LITTASGAVDGGTLEEPDETGGDASAGWLLDDGGGLGAGASPWVWHPTGANIRAREGNS